MNIKEKYGEVYDGDTYLCLMVSSPLGCCGARGIQNLYFEATKEQAVAALNFVESRTASALRLMLILPTANEITSDEHLEDYLEGWGEALKECGWRVTGDGWTNPNSDRVCEIFIKDVM